MAISDPVPPAAQERWGCQRIVIRTWNRIPEYQFTQARARGPLLPTNQVHTGNGEFWLTALRQGSSIYSFLLFFFIFS
jgi:hypothetical protein